MSALLEIASYAVLLTLGGWLVWRHVARARRVNYLDYIRRKRSVKARRL